MDYAKLLFAVEVRKLAISMHQSARAEFIQSGPRTFDDVANYDVKHCLTSFISKALAEIELTVYHMEHPTAHRAGHPVLTVLDKG
jgi:hypothetical protein